jgi:hypothetical protein
MWSHPWFQASATMLMRYALFWGITQRWMVFFYLNIGTAYQSHLQGSRSPRMWSQVYNWCLSSHAGVSNAQLFYRTPISNGGHNREDKEFWFIVSYTFSDRHLIHYSLFIPKCGRDSDFEIFKWKTGHTSFNDKLEVDICLVLRKVRSSK